MLQCFSSGYFDWGLHTLQTATPQLSHGQNSLLFITDMSISILCIRCSGLNVKTMLVVLSATVSTAVLNVTGVAIAYHLHHNQRGIESYVLRILFFFALLCGCSCALMLGCDVSCKRQS